METARTAGPFVDRVGQRLVDALAFAGALAAFASRAVLEAFRPPYEPGEVLRHMYQFGLRSAPLIVTSGFAIGVVLSMHTRASLERFGAESMIPAGLAIALIRETGPLTAGLLVAGRVGAGIGAEIGAMRVTEQIDALESLGRSPVTHLLLPRILGGLFAIPVLVMLANAFGVAVGYIVAQSSLGLTYADFEFGARYFFRPLDLYYSLIKSFAFAGAVTIIPCYIGFNTQQGAEGVGRATTQAVVAASVAVLLLDTILTKLILGTAQ